MCFRTQPVIVPCGGSVDGICRRKGLELSAAVQNGFTRRYVTKCWFHKSRSSGLSDVTLFAAWPPTAMASIFFPDGIQSGS